MAQYNLESLVQAVTEAVMRRLGEPDASPAGRPETAAGPPGQGLSFIVLIPLPTLALDPLARAVRSLIQGGSRVKALVHHGVREEAARQGLLDRLGPDVRDLGDGEATRVLGELSPGDVIVVGTLGFELARGILDLCDSDPAVRIITQGLLRGHRVVAVADDLTAPEGVESAVASKAAQILRELEGLGVRLLALDGLEIMAEELTALERTGSRAFGGLVTEADVEAFAAGGGRRVDLPVRTIVTPLALSRAAELGVELKKGET